MCAPQREVCTEGPASIEASSRRRIASRSAADGRTRVPFVFNGAHDEGAVERGLSQREGPRILEEARKDPTYRNVVEGKDGDKNGDKNREKDQGRERERDRPRPKPRRR